MLFPKTINCQKDSIFLFWWLEESRLHLSKGHWSIYRNPNDVPIRSPKNICSIRFQKNLNTLRCPPMPCRQRPLQECHQPKLERHFSQPFQSNKPPNVDLDTVFQPFWTTSSPNARHTQLCHPA